MTDYSNSTKILSVGNLTNVTLLPEIPFEPPGVLASMTSTPRFGRTGDIAVLLGNNKALQKQYAIGVSIAGIIVACAFVAWAMVLIFFLIYRKFGFLSGKPFQRTITLQEEHASLRLRQQHALREAGSNDSDDAWNEFEHAWRDESLDAERERRAATYSFKGFCGGRPTRVRIIFLLSGLLFVTAAVLSITKGLTHLDQTLYSMDDTATQVHNITETAIILLQDTQERVGGVAETLRTTIKNQLAAGNFCPANPTLDNSTTGQNIRDQATNVMDMLGQIRQFLGESAIQLSAGLYRANQASKQASGYMRGIETDDWKALCVLIPFLVVPVLLMTAGAMALCEVHIPWYNCFISWVIMPLFVLMTTAAWGVAAGMIIVAGIEGDFCLPGGRIQLENSNYQLNPPDVSVLNMLNAAGINGTETYNIVEYFVTQCRVGSDPFDFIRSELPQLENGEASARQLTGLLSDSSSLRELSLYCNRDFSDFQSLVIDMYGVLVTLLNAAIRALDLVDCRRIVPLYTGFVYDGMCKYSASAVFWVFACAIVMGFFGMVMITLRSSYKMTTFVLAEHYEPYDGAETINNTKDSINPILFDQATVKDDVVIQEVEPPSYGGYPPAMSASGRRAPVHNEDVEEEEDHDLHDPVYPAPQY